jgi:hypothetical protein
MCGGADVNLIVPGRAIRPAHAPAGWRDRAIAGVFGAMGLLAAVCGVLLIATDGLGMSRDELRDSPFGSFILPGLILSIVVGGSHIAAAIALLKRHRHSALLALGAGLVMLGWIIVESLMVTSGRGLQVFILAYAVVEIRLARLEGRKTR